MRARNHVGGLIAVVHAGGLAARSLRAAAPYRLVLANILLPPLKRMAAAMTRLVAPGGHVILSGLLDSQAAAAIAAYRAQGLALVDAPVAARLDDAGAAARLAQTTTPRTLSPEALKRIRSDRKRSADEGQRGFVARAQLESRLLQFARQQMDVLLQDVRRLVHAGLAEDAARSARARPCAPSPASTAERGLAPTY